MLRLNSLEIQNYRRFERLVVELEEDLTVLVATNAGGKTTVLEAAAVMLGAFVTAFDEGKGVPIKAEHARVVMSWATETPEPQYPARVCADVTHDGWRETYSLERTGARGAMSSKAAAPLRELGKHLQQKVRDGQPVELPLVAYFGTDRVAKPLSRVVSRRPGSGSRTSGYSECLSPNSTFRSAEQWLHWASLAVLQRARRDEQSSMTAQTLLETVEKVIAGGLKVEGSYPEQRLLVRDVHFDIDSGRTVASVEHGSEPATRLPIASLSDGLRTVLGVLLDLAVRASVLNPHLGGDASQVEGVVLIDEVDMHLHPLWQQQVVSGLQRAFPRLQFIVSTHSPQVLSTVEARCIRVLDDRLLQNSEASDAQVGHARGRTSAHLLEQVQGVSSRPPDVDETKLLARYQELVGSGEGSSARAHKMRKQLREALGELDPDLVRAERLARLAEKT